MFWELTFCGLDMKPSAESSCCKSRKQTVSHRCGFARDSAELTTPWRLFHSPSMCSCTASHQCGKACACERTVGRQMSCHISCRNTAFHLSCQKNKVLLNQKGELKSCLCGVFCAFWGNILLWISFHKKSSPTSCPRESSCELPTVPADWNPKQQMVAKPQWFWKQQYNNNADV